jgi:hypothetical protein
MPDELGDDNPILGELDQENAIVTLFPGRGPDSGFVCFMLRGAPLVVVGDGIYPAVRMSPAQARKVARELVEFAELIEESSDTV